MPPVWSAAAHRARVELAYALRWAGKLDECVALTEHVLREAPASYRWLLGSAHLEHSSCITGLGESGIARTEIERTYSDLSKAGVWPVALRAMGFLTGLECYSGNYGPIWRSATRGLSVCTGQPLLRYIAPKIFNSISKPPRISLDGIMQLQPSTGLPSSLAHVAGNFEMETWDRFDLAGLLQESGDSGGSRRELEEADKILRLGSNKPNAEETQFLRTYALNRAYAARKPFLAANNPQAAIRELDIEKSGQQARGSSEDARFSSGGARASLGNGGFARSNSGPSSEQLLSASKEPLRFDPGSNRIPVLESAPPSLIAV